MDRRSSLSRGRLLVLAIIVIVFLFILYHLRSVLTPFIAAAFLAYALDPVVCWFEKRKLSRLVAIAATYVLVVLFLIVLGLFVVPGLLGEINPLIGNIDTYTEQVQNFLAQGVAYYEGDDIPPMVTNAIDRALAEVSEQLEGILTGLVGGAILGVFGLVGGVFNAVLAVLLAAYMLADATRLRKHLGSALPAQFSPKLMEVLSDINQVLSGFIHGYVLLSLIIGVSVGLIMAVLGVRFFILLGVFAGLTNFIPHFGPFIGAIPAVILAAFDSWYLALMVAVAFIVIQQIESLVLYPRILGEKTDLHPLLVIFALFAGGHLYGLIGMLLGVPVAAVLKVIFVHVWRWILRPEEVNPRGPVGLYYPDEKV